MIRFSKIHAAIRAFVFLNFLLGVQFSAADDAETQVGVWTAGGGYTTRLSCYGGSAEAPITLNTTIYSAQGALLPNSVMLSADGGTSALPVSGPKRTAISGIYKVASAQPQRFSCIAPIGKEPKKKKPFTPLYLLPAAAELTGNSSVEFQSGPNLSHSLLLINTDSSAAAFRITIQRPDGTNFQQKPVLLQPNIVYRHKVSGKRAPKSGRFVIEPLSSPGRYTAFAFSQNSKGVGAARAAAGSPYHIAITPTDSPLTPIDDSGGTTGVTSTETTTTLPTTTSSVGIATTALTTTTASSTASVSTVTTTTIISTTSTTVAASLDDLTELFEITTANERTTLNRVTRQLISTVDITLKNRSQTSVVTPLHAVFNLSSPAVTMPESLGGPESLPYHRFYRDLTSLVSAGGLAPQGSVAFTAQFVRNSGVTFSYTISVFGRREVSAQEHAPVVTVTPATITVNSGESATIDVTGADGDNESVALSATPAVRNGVFSSAAGNPASGRFTFTPDSSQQGLFVVQFAARDAKGNTGAKSAIVSVNRPNRAPTLNVPGTAAVDEGQVLTFAITAADADGDPLAITAAGIPQNGIFVEATRTLTFAPDYSQAGSYPVVFTVTDGRLASPPQTVIVTVNDIPAGGSEPKELILNVDPVESPTLLSSRRITGSVNQSANPSPPPQIVSALITGMSPSVVEQGATATVAITGTAAGNFATHFADGISTADFGSGVTVESLTVLSATSATAVVSVGADAAIGPRGLVVTSGDEQAVSVLALNVVAGRAGISGILRDPDTNQPLSGATITVQGTALTVITAADGSFVLPNVPVGELVLLINPPNHQFFTLAVNAQVGQTVVLEPFGSSSTVFDPTAAPGVSLLSIAGRGAALPITVAKREKVRQMVIDALLLVGGDEAGVIDDYGNQLSTELSGAGLSSLTPKGVELLTSALLADHTYRLVDILFAVSQGFTWGGTGTALTLDEWLGAMQTEVNQAWSDPLDRENALPLIVFSKGMSIPVDPPVLEPLTTLNALQAFLLTNSLMVEMQKEVTRTAAAGTVRSSMYARLSGLPGEISDFLVPSALAQTGTSSRYTRFWRNCFSSKGSWPTYQVRQYGALYAADSIEVALGMGYSSLNLVRDIPAIQGNLQDGFIAMYQSIAPAIHELMPPEIQSWEMTKDGLEINFLPKGEADAYNLIHFNTADSKPRVVQVFIGNSDTNSGNPVKLLDPTPPTAGTTFYTMTKTVQLRGQTKLSLAGLTAAAIAPWWGTAFNAAPSESFDRKDRGAMYAYWLNLRSDVQVSDYGPPKVYSALVQPRIGTIDAVAVVPEKRHVLISETGSQQILIKENLPGGGATPPKVFANTGFKSPGHRWLCADEDGSGLTNNAASNDTFGGRIFRFTPEGAKEFVGSVNYFSQLLMYANPTAVGPLACAPEPDGGLYVYDYMAMQVKRVPYREAWDPYRRVGQLYYGVSAANENVIDLDMRIPETSTLEQPELNVLTTAEILTLPAGEDPGTPITADRTPLEEE